MPIKGACESNFNAYYLLTIQFKIGDTRRPYTRKKCKRKILDLLKTITWNKLKVLNQIVGYLGRVKTK